ncbi:3-hydroxy-3-methylglutaryl-coenzyme A reductase [Pelagirhabdus alkalitolerans]|uniref:3-hydroxy-3-methylglutaryl coenzyme A reductase n=1 Tax=Pelagirhabdus alkalitolerans TaxID=1612202 RepID=A0A1G6HA94_9BACI|nr:hydroxymethylglutaryl-CoA reductase, degradative [Pelagirhabdus alkalitolerans]SDB90356.1 3-hydroxy-3-methylglutaryl-coenzyme A reductase [Pelagirhabdus alkalitolerans]
MTSSPFNKFYKKSPDERIHALIKSGLVDANTIDEFDQQLMLPRDTANHMIENQIGTYQLPLGLGLNFLINGTEYTVPMATEEPSVIAAASFAAKTIKAAGGFETEQKERLMIGQIALKQVNDPVSKKEIVLNHQEELIKQAHAAHPSIVKRGGGIKRIDVRIIDEDLEYGTPAFFVVHLYVDTKEAMGANMINTMAESVKEMLEDLTGGSALMGILSNYATESVVTARCKIKPDLLSRSGIPGDEIRDRIVEASQFATVDPYRAVTNNKGAMNGIDACVLATGNDTRAISSGIHAYASRSGQYRSLTKWSKDAEGNLVGEINIPLPVGTVGGSISIHPGAVLSRQLLGDPNALELAGIIASVALAQNFAAIRALVTDGIQKGHMSLQAKSLAINAGAKDEEVQTVGTALKQEQHMNLETAKAILKKVRNESKR